MATVATGPMSEADANRAGLVESHAYAMLDIRETKVIFIFLSLVIFFDSCDATFGTVFIEIHACTITQMLPHPPDAPSVLNKVVFDISK